MKPFIISAKRLEQEIEHNIKGKGKGVINWFFNSEDNNRLYIYYNIYGVSYLHITTQDELSPNIRSVLLGSGEILGVYEEPEDEAEFIGRIPYQELEDV